MPYKTCEKPLEPKTFEERSCELYGYIKHFINFPPKKCLRVLNIEVFNERALGDSQSGILDLMVDKTDFNLYFLM